MILGVDAQRMAGPRTGVGRTVESLLAAWSKQNHPFERVRVYSREPVELPDDPRLEPIVAPGAGPGIAWYATTLRRATRADDVLVGPYTLPPFPRVRTVVYNLGLLEGPGAFGGLRARGHWRHYRHSARHADAVAAVSQRTADDVVRHFDVDRERIEVVWPGHETVFAPGPGTAPDDAPFLLFVGKLSARRHVPELIEAHRLLRRERPGLRLLVAGPNTSGVALGAPGVEHHPHVGQAALAELYRRAAAFVMPATIEGFSLTIMEAMASGCPAVTLSGAHLGVLEYLDANAPADRAAAITEASAPTPEALAAALAALLDDPAERAARAAAGLRCAAAFPTAQGSAAQLMALLARVATR